MKFLPQSSAEFIQQLTEYSSTLGGEGGKGSASSITLQTFLTFLLNTDLPFSSCEAMTIGRLLVRELKSHRTPKKSITSPSPSPHRRRGDGARPAGPSSTVGEKEEILMESVDISLIENIRRGNYISAAL